MKITAKVQNSFGQHNVMLSTNDNTQTISIPSKQSGSGSSVNGGELLFLALATCYCNDIYREAAKRSIKVTKIDVEVEGEFGAEGEPAKNISYKTKVTAHASETEIHALIKQTDKVAEIQNTLRVGVPVFLKEIDVISMQN